MSMARPTRSSEWSTDESISLKKRQPLLQRPPSSNSSHFHTNTIAEVAGETAAECAAICCCCPVAVVDLLILTMYKLPTGLCRRALRKKRLRKLIKKGLLPRTRNCNCDDPELQLHPLSNKLDLSVNTMSAASEAMSAAEEKLEKEDEAMETLEKEMWDTFFGTGFWRSPSEREAPAGVRKSSGLSPRSEMVVVELFAAALVAKESSC